MPADPLRRGPLRRDLPVDHRRGLQVQGAAGGRQERQVPDLGHGRPGALPHHHQRVLQGLARHPAGVRPHRQEVLRRHRPLLARGGGELRREGRGHVPGGQQGRHGRPPRGGPRDRGEVRRGPRHGLLRVLGQGGRQRGRHLLGLRAQDDEEGAGQGAQEAAERPGQEYQGRREEGQQVLLIRILMHNY